jgi:hypothetical protein
VLAAAAGGAGVGAQGPAPAPPGPYVVDVRVTTIGLPEAAASFPPLAPATPFPARALGLDGGAHVYFGRLGAARLGVGATVTAARGRAAAPSPAGADQPGSGAADPAGPAGTRADLRTIAGQVSFNFGTSQGWSYLSAGGGTTRITVRATDGAEGSRETGGVLTLNGGGGARWFLTRRAAVGFDVRLHRLAETATAPASMLFAVSAGISLR